MRNYAEISRRSFLGTSAASAAALASGMAPALASGEAPIRAAKAWAVGTWGEFDWCHVWAFDEEQAIRIHALNEGMVDPETGEIERHYDAQRCEAWDDLKSDPTPADWIRANMGHLCSRCGHECSGDCGDGNAVGDEAVCTDCMTLADWDVIDPEYAAELREEQGHG